MNQPTQPWTLFAAFRRAEDMETCLAQVKDDLASTPEGRSAQISRTELDNGAPALEITLNKGTLTPLLTYIAARYDITSVTLMEG